MESSSRSISLLGHPARLLPNAPARQPPPSPIPLSRFFLARDHGAAPLPSDLATSSRACRSPAVLLHSPRCPRAVLVALAMALRRQVPCVPRRCSHRCRFARAADRLPACPARHFASLLNRPPRSLASASVLPSRPPLPVHARCFRTSPPRPPRPRPPPPAEVVLAVLVAQQFEDTLVRTPLSAGAVSFALVLSSSAGALTLSAFVEPLVIFLILVVNAAIGVWQETNAEKALEALRQIQSDHAAMLRCSDEEKVLLQDVLHPSPASTSYSTHDQNQG
ncbi:hypothetical protein ZWY2020_012140 [Hordeum vulgare]|nr:hypothetical protein ZWY2020_012140 [Hordeum vulgare]